MSDPVATALTLASLRAQRDEMKAVIEQASAALALAGFGGGLLAQVGAALARISRLEARKAVACDCGRGWTRTPKGTVPCPPYRSPGDALCPPDCACGGRGFVACSTCGGSGAFIAEPAGEGST